MDKLDYACFGLYYHGAVVRVHDVLDKNDFIYPNSAKEIPSRHYQNIIININHNAG